MAQHSQQRAVHILGGKHRSPCRSGLLLRHMLTKRGSSERAKSDARMGGYLLEYLTYQVRVFILPCG